MDVALIVQAILGGLFSVGAIIIGIVLTRIYKKMDDLDKTDQELNDKIFKLGVQMPSKYVNKEEFYRLMDRILETLEKIDTRLADKVDKRDQK